MSPTPAAPVPYRILERKRAGLALRDDEIRAVVTGSLRNWSDAQLGAFLMAAAIHELGAAETRTLTEGMLRPRARGGSSRARCRCCC